MATLSASSCSASSSSGYLAPPILSRPAPKRQLSLQIPLQRPSPYPTSSSGSNGLKRPGAPKRAHSFCGDSAASTYALASTSTSSHLTADKKCLIAPPLERTISSIGSKGNMSPLSQQMPRPFSMTPTPISTPSIEKEGFVLDRRYLKESSKANVIPPYSAPILSSTTKEPIASPLPRILVHPSTTPPRPSLATIRQYPSSSSEVYTPSSRSSSYSTVSPTTPSVSVFPISEENDDTPVFGKARDDTEDREELMMEVDDVVERVTDLSVC